MALTRPTFQNLNSNLTTFSDSTLVVNFANVANRDLGILFDRSQATASNVALVWQESTQSFKLGYTSSTGLDSANLTFTGNANIRVGNLYAESISYANGSPFSSSVPGGSNTQLQYNNNGSFAGASGLTTDGTDLTSSGNITANGLTINISGTFGTTLSAAGGVQNTPIGNVTPSTALFTTIGASGNITGAALTSNASITAITTLSALGGVQNTPIGNVTPSSALFTTIGSSGNTTVSALTVNGTATVGSTLGVTGNINGSGLTLSSTATVGSTLGVTGNINGSSITLTGSGVLTNSLRAQGGLQATPIGNASASSGQFTTVSATGNVTGAALTSNASITAVTTLSALGGVQNTPIGNVTPSTALFTTVGASSNATVAALTVNGTATVGSTLGVTGNLTVGTGTSGNIFGVNSIYANSLVGNANSTIQALTINTSATVGTTLQAVAGLQNTPIGNVTPSSALFTTVGTSSNATVAALTVNGSATIGTTLGVTGNAIIGNISVGKISSSDTTNATGTGTGAFIVVGGGSVTKDFWVGGNLYTTNLIAISTSNITVQDPLLYLTANTPYPYSYEIGFYSQFDTTGTNYQHTGFIRDHTDNVWKLVSNITEPTGQTVDFTNANVIYDSIKTGNATVGNLTSLGNINGSYIFGNGSQLTGVSAVTAVTTQYVTGLTNANVTTALGYVPLDSNGTAITATTATYVTGLTGTNVNVALGYVPLNSNTTALTAQYVTQAAQANITSVGTLTGLTLSGTLNGTTLQAATIGNSGASFTGNGRNITGVFADTATTATYVTGLTGTNVNVALGYVPLNSNATALTAQYVTQAAQSNITSVGVLTSLTSSGNLTASGLTVNNSVVIGTTANVVGNLRAGNISVSGLLGIFGNLSAGNILAAFELSGSRLENTPIGTITPRDATFTGASISGNATINGLTINNSATIGSTLGVTGNINGSSLTLTGSQVTTGPAQALGGLQATPIGNASASTGQFTTVSATGNITGAALTSNASITAITTISGLGGLQNTPVGNATPNSGNFTTLNASTSATAAELTVNGAATIGSTLTTTGNSTINALTINNSVTVGTTLGVTGNITAAGNVIGANFFYSNGTAVGGGGGGGTGITYTANTAPPTSGNIKGDQWYNTSNDALYEYQYDGTSYYWVDVTGAPYSAVAVANTSPVVYNGIATNVTTTATLIDSISVTGNTSIAYTFSAIDTTNSRFKTSKLDTTNDGTNVYYTEYAVVLSNNSYNVAVITSNISGGQLRIYAQGDSASTTVAFQRTVLGTTTSAGYMVAGSSTTSADTFSPFLLMGA